MQNRTRGDITGRSKVSQNGLVWPLHCCTWRTGWWDYAGSVYCDRLRYMINWLKNARPQKMEEQTGAANPCVGCPTYITLHCLPVFLLLIESWLISQTAAPVCHIASYQTAVCT